MPGWSGAVQLVWWRLAIAGAGQTSTHLVGAGQTRGWRSRSRH